MPIRYVPVVSVIGSIVLVFFFTSLGELIHGRWWDAILAFHAMPWFRIAVIGCQQTVLLVILFQALPKLAIEAEAEISMGNGVANFLILLVIFNPEIARGTLSFALLGLLAGFYWLVSYVSPSSISETSTTEDN